MPRSAKYTVFKTKWGYFGLVGTESGLLRTYLPLPKLELVKAKLLPDFEKPQCTESLFKTVQEQITAYFEGACVSFDRNTPIVLDGFGSFSHSVLTACREIRFGETISYGGLARKVGKPSATRAVGRVMANNPLPLIIPCHRIIRTDGQIGGFSAAGGVSLKKRMLELERQARKP